MVCFFLFINSHMTMNGTHNEERVFGEFDTYGTYQRLEGQEETVTNVFKEIRW